VRKILLILAAGLLLAGLAGCSCGASPFADWCDAGYYNHCYGDTCPVCGGTGYYQGRCSRYETVWRGCRFCSQW
jgi:hypothetical protein